MSDFNTWIYLKQQDEFMFILDIETPKFEFPYWHWVKSKYEFYFDDHGIGDPEEFEQRNINREADPKLTIAEMKCMIANLFGEKTRYVDL